MTKPMRIWPVIIVAGLATAPLVGDGTPAWALATEIQKQGVTAPEIMAGAPDALPVSRAPGDPLPVAGTDTIIGTEGEIHIEAVAGNIYGLTPETYVMAIDPDPLNNLTVVERQDPVCDPYGTIDMEMTSLDLVASDGIFTANVHLNPLVASTGQAVEPAVGSSCDFPVDSFFDVYVEIDIPAIPTGTLHNNGPIYIYAPDNVSFPPYGSSYQTVLGWDGEQLYDGTDATGLWVRYVQHDVRQDCGPDPTDPHQCLQVDCSLLGFPTYFQCLPSLINWDSTNLDYSVIQCECQDPDYCHIEPGAAGQPPSCTGSCPSPQICVEHQQDLGDGTIDYWCQCEEPAEPCDVTPDLKACAGTCPVATPDCRPTRLIRSTTGTYQVDLCECVDPNSDCWLGYDEANDQVWCEGVCPDPTVCTLMSRGAPQGYIEFWCECHDPGNPPPCGPYQGLVCEGACPNPQEACVPVEWTEVTADQFDITACECRGFDDCRGMGDLLSPPTCQGNCPTPEVCNMTQPTPQSYRCDCEQPYTEACCFQDGSCLDLDPNDCGALGGQSQGSGSACANVTSACCLGDGSCLMADEYCCVHDLNGTVYSGQNCLGVAACCFDDGSCVDMDRLCCEVDQGGVAQPAGTACVDTLVACCLDDGTCVETDPLCCDELGGVLSGEAACLGDSDGDLIDDACEDCYPSAALPGCQEDFCPPDYECLENRVIRWPDGNWTVDACECVKRTEDCWVEYDAAADQVWCNGACPAPEECTLISRGTASGYIEFWCECHDPNNPPPCGPQGDPPFVCEGACPPDEACVPAEYWWDPVLQQLIVTQCECRGFNECRGYTNLLVPPTCQGDCPPFEVCDLVEIDTDGDQVADTYRCECEDSCQPTPDNLDCEQVLCPAATEECLPVRIRGPAPFFPPGGIDILHGTSGELEIVDPDGDSSIFFIDPASEPNVTVVERQNPVGGGGGGAVIDMTITQMNFDSNDGMLKVTVRLGSVAPSTGQVIGYSDTQDYPAESFFDVYVEVDVEGFGTGLYNADPIHIEAAGLTTIPPWGVQYETPPTMADVPLYLPGGQPSNYYIRRVTHIPPPPPPPYEVLECDCIDLDHCHVEFDQASPTVPPWCSGGCPAGYRCEMQQYADPTGWIEYWCECNCACGDIDHSGGAVDLNDFAVFALCYGYTAPSAACPPPEFDCSDLDQSGAIDLNDFATFATLFGLTSTQSPPNCHLP